MPRVPRGETSNRIYHVINRGVEKRPIFQSAEDYGFFLSQTRDVFASSGIALFAYVLMPNHYHLLAGVNAAGLGPSMNSLQTRYSMYFNRINERVGHLFQDRFKAFEADEPAYLEWLPVYIHRNPVKAGLVQKPSDWQWSGHSELLSTSQRYLDLTRLAAYGEDRAAFVRRYLEQSACFERPLAEGATLEDILRWAAKQNGVRWQDLKEGARGGPFTRAKLMLLEAAQARGYTLSAVAALLGSTPAALSGLRAAGD